MVPATFPSNKTQTSSSQNRLVRFEPVTLVPFEAKLIDRSQLSREQVDWLAGYNRKIYETVGLAFKRAGNGRAFRWVEARTRPLRGSM